MEKEIKRQTEDIRTIRTKRDLANSLEQLLMKKDIDEISIKDITDNALISKNTFYNNFQDKNELLLFLFARYKESLIVNIKPLLEKNFRPKRLMTFKKCLEITVHFFYTTDLPFSKIIENDSSRVIFYNLNLFVQDLLKKFDLNYHILTNKAKEEVMIPFYAGAFSNVLYFSYKNHVSLTEKDMVKNVFRLAFPVVE